MINNTAFITGGSRGIGAAAVKLFASRSYNVAFTYLNSDKAASNLVKECGESFPSVRVIACKSDSANRIQCENAYSTAKAALGDISVLVNNAGISQFKLFDEITAADWERMIAVNLTGVFNFCQLASADMIRAKRGSIVNISSIWGEVGASCEVHYSASKAAVIGLTKALAKELGPSGIRVNCIAPGVIDTEMNAMHSEETLDELCNASALCRIGTAEEVAEAIFFLASESSSFITGQTIGVNGLFPL